MNFLSLGEVFGYFFRVFGKKDPSKPDTSYLRMMHGINRISIVMFLFCVLVMLYRAFLRWTSKPCVNIASKKQQQSKRSLSMKLRLFLK